MTDAQIHEKELRSLKTAWLESGNTEGPLLLFLHGYPDDPHTWDFQIEAFKKDFHIICPFTRGTTPSESPQGLQRYSQDALTLDLLELIKEVDPTGEKSVYCVGHDLGAVQAWNVAPLLGDRLKGLIILDGLSVHQMVHRLTNPKQHLRSWYIYFINLPYLPDFIASHFSEKILQFAFEQGGLPPELRPHVNNPGERLTLPLKQYRAFVRETVKTAKQHPKKLSCPCLVLWGRKDAFLLPPTLSELEPYATNLTVRLLDGNHWIHRECHEDVNHLIEEFLKSKP